MSPPITKEYRHEREAAGAREATGAAEAAGPSTATAGAREADTVDLDKQNPGGLRSAGSHLRKGGDDPPSTVRDTPWVRALRPGPVKDGSRSGKCLLYVSNNDVGGCMNTCTGHHELFIEQEPKEKRRLLAFMVSSASWKEGELSVNLRQPFNLIRDGIAAATAAERSATIEDRSRTGRVLALSNSPKGPISNLKAVGLGPSQGKMANWLPLVDALRTLVVAPAPEVRETIDHLRFTGSSWLPMQVEPTRVLPSERRSKRGPSPVTS